MSRRTVIAVAIISLTVLLIGWAVYDSTTFFQSITGPEKVPAKSLQEQLEEQTAGSITTPDGQIQNLAVSPGNARYTDTANGIRFYYPEQWDRNSIKVQKVPVAEAIQGTQFGTNSAMYQYDQSSGVLMKRSNTFTANEYEKSVGDRIAKHGLEGNSSGVAYFIVFGDSTNAYMIEGPVVPKSDTSLYPSIIANPSLEVIKGIRFLQ